MSSEKYLVHMATPGKPDSFEFFEKRKDARAAAVSFLRVASITGEGRADVFKVRERYQTNGPGRVVRDDF